LYEYFEAEQKRLQCTMQGEYCQVKLAIFVYNIYVYAEKVV
jgi:hypothetical protein